MDKKQLKTVLKKTWYFIWEDDSVLSWIVNIILAFILIKFLVYPGLGLVLGGTSHPIVAVVSSSMEHDGSFDMWWEMHEGFYDNYNISKDGFMEFPFENGFNKGDIMVLYRSPPESIDVGDVIVFKANRPDPIIHRVVKKWEDDGYHFQTKGDHNPASIRTFQLDETDIQEENLVGEAVVRIPLLGWVKIGAVELLAKIGLVHAIS